MGVHDFTVYDMYRRNAKLFKNITALVCADKRITFGELLGQVQSLSGGLLTQEIHQGDRIAILAQNNCDFFLLYGAAAAMGVIVVPINWRLSIEEIKYILQDSAPTAICFDGRYKNIIMQLHSECKSLQYFFVFGEPEAGYVSLTELRGDYPSEEVEVKGTDPYIIIYTAAVQGQPRGAVLTHGNVIFCNVQTVSMMGLSLNDAYLNILPLFHVGGVAMAFSVMHVGGKNVVMPSFDPKEVLGMIEKERITIMGSFPPILTQLSGEISEGIYDLTSLKHVFGLDHPDNIADFERRTGSQFWLPYGQTETMGLTCLCPNYEKTGSAGRQGLLVDVKIVDEYDRDVEPGEKGEILARGPLVFQGYWKQGELTRHTFRGGWHHTGDIGRLDKEGYLWYVGRKAEKELIKSGGENVYPVEVEKVILDHPGINEVAVIGVHDPEFGEGIRAVCVLKPNVILSEQELIDFVAARIARYKKPRHVSFVDSLPKKVDGSIDREKVKTIHGHD
jgi:acyl-CoA synthetase (AMP-forming)/AMP-acid ligase II